ITEICTRAPLCMKAELLSDLVEYRRERKSKSVVIAARRLMNLYRDVLPHLLPANARGKDASIEVQNTP
ncbi:sda1-like protein, partial [Cystoisospora suis]